MYVQHRNDSYLLIILSKQKLFKTVSWGATTHLDVYWGEKKTKSANSAYANIESKGRKCIAEVPTTIMRMYTTVDMEMRHESHLGKYENVEEKG